MFDPLDRRRSLPAALCALSLAGCASGPEPLRVRYADLDAGALRGFTGEAPLVVEFQPGDRLPVALSFTAPNFALDPAAPALTLVARTHCFVRFDSSGIAASDDGVHFDRPRVPGSFRIAFATQRGKPTHLDVVIVAPRR